MSSLLVRNLVSSRLAVMPITPVTPAAAAAPILAVGPRPVEMVTLHVSIPAKHQSRVDAAQAVFNAVRELINAEIEGDDDQTVARRRRSLNAAYESFAMNER